ncbi:imm11 family protein [Brevibacillus invocatus]|uniref:imm11 family protein n=1 Tax=Brevibacillus invocatus TaxID=173959 RepID=UPI0039F0C3D8
MSNYEIDSCNNEELEGYSVCNIYNLVDALDLANSDYTEFELDENEKVLSVKKYALKYSELKEVHLLRLTDDPFGIFVSEIVKKTLNENNITGCDFLEVRVS